MTGRRELPENPHVAMLFLAMARLMERRERARQLLKSQEELALRLTLFSAEFNGGR